MELKRIKLKEYLGSCDLELYNFAIRYSDDFRLEQDTLSIGDIYEVPFGIIKDIQTDLESHSFTFLTQIEYALRIVNDKNIDIYEMWLDEFCRGVSWLLSEVIELLNTENELLSGGEVSSEEEAAGINNFQQLGIYLQIRDLAGKDITKIEHIKSLPYSVCFLELYTRKIEREFNKNHHEIMMNKNK